MSRARGIRRRCRKPQRPRLVLNGSAWVALLWSRMGKRLGWTTRDPEDFGASTPLLAALYLVVCVLTLARSAGTHDYVFAAFALTYALVFTYVWWRSRRTGAARG